MASSGRRHGCDGPLFRGRYKALLIETDPYLLQLVRYIHRNPLEAGLARSLSGYPWSSHQGYLSRSSKWKWLYKDGVLEMLTAKPAARIEGYRRFVWREDREGLRHRIWTRRLEGRSPVAEEVIAAPGMEVQEGEPKKGPIQAAESEKETGKTGEAVPSQTPSLESTETPPTEEEE